MTNTHCVYYNRPYDASVGVNRAREKHGKLDFSQKGVRAMTTASQPMDKRMLRTREAIRCALLSLLNQKDASQINVSELTENFTCTTPVWMRPCRSWKTR